MHINVEPGDDHVVLHIRGERHHCHLLEEEIAAIQKNGIHQAVLNLRLVKFINSTALGAIIKASKALGKEGASSSSRVPPRSAATSSRRSGSINKPVADSDEDAIHMLKEGLTRWRRTPRRPRVRILVDLPPGRPERLRHVERLVAKNPLHGHAFGELGCIGRMSA